MRIHTIDNQHGILLWDMWHNSNFHLFTNYVNRTWTLPVFERVDLLPRHPAQLYESITYFSFFILIYYLYKTKKKFKSGFLFGLILFLIFTFRFFIEFIKERQVDFESNLFLDMGQILSIPFILLGLFFMLFANPSTKQTHN